MKRALWLDEIVRLRPDELATLTRPSGRIPYSEKESADRALIRQFLSVPYRDAVVSVHRTAAGAKMARRRLVVRELWANLEDVRFSQKQLAGGYSAVVAKYMPDLLARLES